MNSLSQSDTKIKTKFVDASWKRVQYRGCEQEGNRFWGLCKWVNSADATLDGKAYLYKSNKTHEALIGGSFKAGKLVAEEKHYLFLENGSHYYGKLNEELQPHGYGELFNINGSIYQGNFVNGIPHGYGELSTREKTYKGTFVNGEKSKG